MDLDPTTRDFLNGERFSNAHRFALGNAGRAPRRADRLVAIARGRSVLHVGCCDHLELIRAKLAQGTYLHRQLCDAAKRCVGMDTSEPGVALLHELGFSEVYAPDEVPDDAFDVCLLADVIEHVGDVVRFLASMRRYRFRELVVATPNAFRLRNFLSSGELINTDHRYWFTPYTLCKVLVDAGYTPTRVELCHADHVSAKGALLARVLDWMPKYRDTLIVSATPGR
ncbi:MAG TPA: methyltransferase domain-containing protein [Burkholderiaceae bacterium]|nr:methyltransferase domain-containing protein [Burkholderiaceae bacterium]